MNDNHIPAISCQQHNAKIIQVGHVSAGYKNKPVLENISFDVFERDFLGIIGPNGGGKTTLVRVLLGLLKPTCGHIQFYIHGTEANGITMGYLPQYNEIDRKFPISVYEVVLSGLTKQKHFLHPYTKEQHTHVAETLKEMQLEGLEQTHIGNLSGGQLQRVLLARAIVAKPKVVVLDEPNTYIDQRFQKQMYQLLREINHECAVIIVSHDIGTVLEEAKHVLCVNHTAHYHASNEISENTIKHYYESLTTPWT